MKLILPALMLLLLPVAFAELFITPAGYDGTVYVNTEQKVEFSLYNNFSFPIHNLNFTTIDYATFDRVDSIPANSTVKINVTIKTDIPFERRVFNTVIKFWYYSQINLDPKTYEVNITNESFVPTPITIKQGDRIKFNCLRSIYASIRDQYSPTRYFDNIIEPNQSVTISTFNNVDSFTYSDTNALIYGNIIVENKSTELVNNPNYNIPLTIAYNSLYTASTLKLELFPYSNISMAYNEFQELNLRVWNDGTSLIHNVTLSVSDRKDWFAFETNNFDLTSNQNRYIKIRITPTINETKDTNKTYSINVLGNSQNTPQAVAPLQIQIPFASEIYRIVYGEDFWKGKEIFCTKFPNALECNPPVKIEKVIEIQYLNSTIEYTKEEALKNDRQTNERLSSMETLQQKQTESLNIYQDRINALTSNLDTLTDLLNASNTIAEKARKSATDSAVATALIILLLCVLAFGGIILYKMKKKTNELVVQHE